MIPSKAFRTGEHPDEVADELGHCLSNREGHKEGFFRTCVLTLPELSTDMGNESLAGAVMLKPVGLVISPSNPCGKNTPLPSGLPRVTMLIICIHH